MFNPGAEISSLDFGAIIGGSLNAVVKAQSQSAQTTVDFIKRVGFQKKSEVDEHGNKLETDVPVNVAFSYDKEVSPAQVLTTRKYEVVVENAGGKYTDSNKSHYQLTSDQTTLPIKEIELKDGGVKAISLGEISDELDLSDGDKLTLTYIGEGKQPENAAKLTLKIETKSENVPAVIQKMNIQVPILTMLPIPFIKIESADIEFNVKINSVSTTSSEQKSDAKGSASIKSNWFVKADLSASFSNQKSTNSSEEVKKDYSLNIKVHAAQDDMPAGVSRILDILEETITAQPAGTPKTIDTQEKTSTKENGGTKENGN